VTTPRLSDLKSRRLWRQFFGSAFSTIGLAAVVLGLYDVLFPSTVDKIGKPAVVVILVGAVLYGLLRAWPRVVQVNYRSPNTTITIIPGDLLTDDAHLVIGMTDTFDTTPGVIAQSSLQAKFLDRLLGGDTARFDRGIEQSLAAEGVVKTGTVQKPGKTNRYPLGTVATLEEGRRRFFCVGVVESLSALWKAVCRHANGESVAMPVIGMGQSRLSQALSPSDAIRLQVLSFWLASREERRCQELRIVVLPEVYDTLDRGSLQDFLNGLGK
jgi:hypothetical protein